MKIVILLFTFMVLLNLTSAAIGNSTIYHMHRGEYADFDIPLRCQVYVQTPGDHVFINTSPLLTQNQIPLWALQPFNTETDEVHVYVRMFGGNGLTTNLVPLHNYAHSDHVYEYHCYILLPNNTVVHAYLYPGIHARHFVRSTTVFVQIPGGHNDTFSGVLVPFHGRRPLWLPHTSSIPRPRN